MPFYTMAETLSDRFGRVLEPDAKAAIRSLEKAASFS